MQQSWLPTWAYESPAEVSEANYEAALTAIRSVDWMSLPDFEAVMRVGAELGLWGGSPPTRLGGLGLTTRQFSNSARVFESLDTGAAHSIGYQNSLGVLPLLFANTPVADALVPEICAGRELSIFAITEPQGGSFMRGMQDFARRENGRWILNGTKANIAHAQDGSLFLVAARGHGVFRLFIVRRDQPGVKVTRSVHPAYMPRIYINDLSFTEVEVEDSHVITDPSVVYDAMMLTRIYIAAGKLGHMDRCLGLIDRQIEGRFIATGPMAKDPSVRRRIQIIRWSRALLEALLEQVYRLEESQQPVPYEFALAAKVVGVQAALEASDIMQTLHGARGVDSSTGIHRAADDVKNWRIMEGAPEPMMQYLAVSAQLDRNELRAYLSHPLAARLPAEPPGPDADTASLGGAIAWLMALGCAQAHGTLDAGQQWLAERQIDHYLRDFAGPPSP